jgi:beta-glucanase (GH16 family)
MDITPSISRFLSRRLSLASSLALVLLSAVFPSRSAAQTWGNPVWFDEFNGAANSAIDPTKWQYDTKILNVNNEVEYYCAPGDNTAPCSASTPNAYIDGNGHLIIQAIKINSSVTPYSGSWTSARLNTANNLKSFQYGRLESRISLPIGAGIWPAYWALGDNISSVGWPASGEIDFMENVPASPGNLGPNVIKSTLHGGNSSSNCYCGSNGLGQTYMFPSNDPNGPDVTTFHTYGAIWSTNMVQFYVDDPTHVFLVRTVNDVPAGLTWDFNHPFFVLLNLAIGGTGSWPGPPDSTTPNPALMTVDYVRWYTPSAVAGPTMSGTPITTKAGSPASSTISLSSTSGTGRVYLSCTTTAPKASCSINSSDALNPYTVDFSNTASASATVNVTTTTNSAGLLAPNRELNKRALSAGIFEILGFLFVSVILLPAKWGRRVQRTLGGAGLMLVLLVHPGCGGGSSSSTGGGGGGGGNGTTPGNYSVTVNAYTVSNSSGNPDSTTTVALTVN